MAQKTRQIKSKKKAKIVPKTGKDKNRSKTHKHVSREVLAPGPSVIIQCLLQTVSSIGGNPRALLRRAKADLDADRLIKGDIVSISNEQFSDIFSDAIQLIEAYSSRQMGRDPMTKLEVDMLCYCVIGCSTLIEAIKRASDFCAMLNGRAGKLEIDLSPDGREATFNMRTIRKSNISSLLSDLTGLVFYHTFFSWLIGVDLPVRRATLAHPALVDEKVLVEFFPYDVRLVEPNNSFTFSSKYLRWPIVRASTELTPLLAKRHFGLSRMAAAPLQFSGRVTALIGAALAQGRDAPTISSIGRQFSQSVATIRRRLVEEGHTFRSLKQACCYTHARRLLSDTTLTLGSIGDRMGFSDLGSFNRAFKRWSGQSPSSFRKMQKLI